MVDVVAVEAALKSWVMAGTGLDAEHVFIDDGQPRPSMPYIAMTYDIIAVGRDWIDEAEAAGTPATGEEIELHARGYRRVELFLQCLAAPPQGASAARAILSRLVGSVALYTQQDRLQEGKLAYVTSDPIQSTPKAFGTIFEPRAMTTCRFNTVSEQTERTGYIETATVTPEVDEIEGDPFTLTIEAP